MPHGRFSRTMGISGFKQPKTQLVDTHRLEMAVLVFSVAQSDLTFQPFGFPILVYLLVKAPKGDHLFFLGPLCD